MQWYSRQCDPHHIPHSSSNLPLRYKFLGISLLVAVPACHAPPPLPPHLIWSFLHVKSLLGARRGENHWVPILVSMAGEVTPLVWNPESVLEYEGLYDVDSSSCCRHALEGNKPRSFLRIAGFSWVWSIQLYLSGISHNFSCYDLSALCVSYPILRKRYFFQLILCTVGTYIANSSTAIKQTSSKRRNKI